MKRTLSGPGAPTGIALACAALLAAAPAWAQAPGYGPQPGGPSAPLAFGVPSGGDWATAPAPGPVASPAPYGGAPPPQDGPDPQVLQQLAQAERQDYGVPPTKQLHAGAPHAPTPASLPGGQVITTLGLVSLLRQPGVPVVLLDALGGSSHLPNAVPAAFAAQSGSFNDGVQAQLAQVLAQATSGNKSQAIVAYCSDPHCWMSYNAALRTVALGYGNVLWYRGGLWAWQQAGLAAQQGAADGVPPRAGPVSGAPLTGTPPSGVLRGPPPTTPVPAPVSQAPGTQAPVTQAPGAQAPGVATTMGEIGRRATYGQRGRWLTKASPEGALVYESQDGASGWTANIVPAPALPYVVQVEVGTTIAPLEDHAVGAGVAFGYKRAGGGAQGPTFYAALIAGDTLFVYRYDGSFDELSRTSVPGNAGGRWGTLRVTVRQDGFSVSLNDGGEVTQSFDGPIGGEFGTFVSASSGSGSAFRNLYLH